MKTKLFCLMAMQVLAGVAQAEEPLRVVTEGTFPPYSMTKSDGSLTGFDVDIANALCAEMKVKCQMVANEFDGIIPGLIARKFDIAVASMAITPERQKAVAFSDKYQGGYSTFVGRIGQKLDGSPASMKGKNIAVQTGTIQANYAKAVYAPAGASLRMYSTVENALLDVTSGRVDALMVEIGSAYELKKTPKGKLVEMFGPKMNDPKYFGTGSGIAVRKDEKVLLGKLNAALKTIIANGTYKKINNKYFDYNQYD
ncbi:transporter substrate-binding domain-containing protein [Vogesella sp. GCM10023246]|uniref:Transporter substrate-binding domain-containing protein n=1 Tax=Vogesella oryzagri TaxID=3160864 RepID=A0ABV1M7T7_9NEIS